MFGLKGKDAEDVVANTQIDHNSPIKIDSIDQFVVSQTNNNKKDSNNIFNSDSSHSNNQAGINGYINKESNNEQ